MQQFNGSTSQHIVRSGRNGHRYICFAGGRILTFTTHEKDFLFNLAALFGCLNGGGRLVYRFARIAVGCALVLMLLTGERGWALPQGWQVESGDVSFEVNQNTLNVTSASQKAVVNYQSFNVAGGETVNFIFLLPGGSILNRVLGGGASSIAGAINSTGNVLLVNPAGIQFASTVNINVGSLIASTLDIQSNDFLSGNYVFARTGDPAAIRNEGRIQAANFAVMLASAVENQGSITAADGTVHLAVGDRIRLSMGDNHAVDVTVDQALIEQVQDVQDAIANRGEITAKEINLEARLAQDLYTRAVNNEGVIRSSAVVAEGGKIRLVADGQGDALMENTGTIDGQGAEVALSGDTVVQAGKLLSEGADNRDGGNIGIQATRQAILTEGSETSVRGHGEHSDGGEIMVWSDHDTRFDENAVIDVSGGEVSGDGGFAEVSAKDTVYFNGIAKGGATDGQAGHILVDPTTIKIQAAGPNGSGNVAYNAANNNGGNSIFAAASFAGFANVTLEATDDIDIEAPWALTGVTAGNSLTLRAGDNIELYDSVSTAGGNINLMANYQFAGSPASGDGEVVFHNSAPLNSNGGSITMQGWDLQLDSGSINSGGGNITLYAADDVYVTATVNSGGGNIAMRANYDIPGATVPSGSGQVFVYSGGAVSSGGGNILMEGQDVEIYDTVNAGAGQVTFRAFDDVYIDAPLVTTGGNINLYGNQDLGTYAPSGNGDVDVAAGGSIDTNGGVLLVEGWDSDIDGTVTTDGGTINWRTADDLTLTGTIDSGGGAINLRANYNITGSSVQSGTGFINLLGAGSLLDSGNADILVEAADLDLDGLIDAGTGKLTIRNITNTAGNDIQLGNALDDDGGGNDLVVSAAELGRINAQNVRIETLGTHTITILGDIDLNGAGPGKYNLSLYSTDDIDANNILLNNGNHTFDLEAEDNVVVTTTGNNRGIHLSSVKGNTAGTFIQLQTDGLNSDIIVDGNITSAGDTRLQTLNSDISVGGNLSSTLHTYLITGADSNAGTFDVGGTVTIGNNNTKDLTVQTAGGNLLAGKLNQALIRRRDVNIQSYGTDHDINITGNWQTSTLVMRAFDPDSAITLNGNVAVTGTVNIQTNMDDITVTGNLSSGGNTTIVTGWTENDGVANIGGTLTLPSNPARNLTLYAGGGNLLQKINQNLNLNDITLVSYGNANPIAVNGNMTAAGNITVLSNGSDITLNGNMTLTGNSKTLQVESYSPGSNTTINGSLNAAGTDQDFTITSRYGDLTVGDVNHTGSGGEVRFVAGWGYNEDFRAYSNMTLGTVNITQRAGKLLKIKTGSDAVFSNPFFNNLTGFDSLYINRGAGFYNPNHVVTAGTGLYWASGQSVNLDQAGIDALVPRLSAPNVYLQTGANANLTVSGNLSTTANFFKMQTTGNNSALTVTGRINSTGSLELATDADNSPLTIAGTLSATNITLQTNEESLGSVYSPIYIGTSGPGGAPASITGTNVRIDTLANPGVGTVIHFNNGSVTSTVNDIIVGDVAASNALAGDGNVRLSANRDLLIRGNSWNMSPSNTFAITRLSAKRHVTLSNALAIDNHYATVYLTADTDLNGAGDLSYLGSLVPGDFLRIDGDTLPSPPATPSTPYILTVPGGDASATSTPAPVQTVNAGAVTQLSGDALSLDASEPGMVPVSSTGTVDMQVQRSYEIRYGNDFIVLLDSVTHDPVATVPVGSSPVDSSIARNGSLAYVANAGDGTVSVVDLEGFKVVETIEVGARPSHLFLSPSGRSLYVYSQSEKTLITIDTQRNQVLSAYRQSEAGPDETRAEADSLPFTARARQNQSRHLAASINNLVNRYFGE